MNRAEGGADGPDRRSVKIFLSSLPKVLFNPLYRLLDAAQLNPVPHRPPCFHRRDHQGLVGLEIIDGGPEPAGELWIGARLGLDCHTLSAMLKD